MQYLQELYWRKLLKLNDDQKEFVNSRRSFVPPTGPYDTCSIAEVGEQPGRTEVARRIPFVGDAGIELDSCNNDAGIARLDCYLTNVIKDLDLPLKHYIDLSISPPIISELGRSYINLLKDELTNCSANVIVAIGAIALYALTDRTGITNWRGSILESTLIPNRKIIPVIHPATVIPPKNVYLNKHLITMDLKRVLKESASSNIDRVERKIKIKSSFYETMRILDWAEREGLNGLTIDYDIECHNRELGCISFAIGENFAISIPFIAPGGDYFSPDQEGEVMIKINKILSDKRIKKRGQNIIFDSHFLLEKYGIRTNNIDDTMVAQKILFQDFPVRLEFITAMYTDIPYYKKDGKIWLTGRGSWEQGWIYNANDSLACASAYPKQAADLEKQNNVETYNRQMKMIPPLTYMMERKIKVNLDVMKEMADNELDKIDKYQEELNQLCKRDMNANSPKQVSTYFYLEKGVRPYKTKGRVTTDEDALKRIFRKGYKEARLILDIRGAVKRRSTYLNPEKVDPDKRIRSSYNPVGTRFSRISSSANIFKMGMNMQNWPHDLMRCLEADDGYIYYSFDLSQFENRIVAYVGNVTPMIDAFESGKDVHRLTASLVFNKPVDEISDKPGSSSLSGGRFSERFWGKKSNHELNYDMGYKSFSLECEIPERDGKYLHAKYHAMYPEVRENYQVGVRSQLAKDRTLTNLFGRKTLFLDNWGDRLFKVAYSCIPQGTCGDKINEDGIEFIYYNQQWFKAIELLSQIHDSVGFQIPLSISWLEHAEMLIRIKNNLEKPLRWKGREFVVPVDLLIGLNMCKEDGVEIKAKEFPNNASLLANKLSIIHNNLKSNVSKG